MRTFLQKSLLTLVCAGFFLIFVAFTPTHTAAQTAAPSTAPTAEELQQTILNLLQQNTQAPSIKDFKPNPEPNINDLPAEFRKIPLIVDFSPEIPGPNQKIQVKIESYGNDLNRAEITWKINGKILKQGVGEKNFTFTTGKLGAVSSLAITVEAIDGNISTSIYRIVPAEVDIIWEADTYVPPFYKGKALPSYQSRIKVTAVPNIMLNGARIPAQNLVYKWTKNDKVLDADSGFGKHTIYLEDTVPMDQEEVNVQASTIDGDIVTEKTIFISQVNPRVLVYENSPIKGIAYQKALLDNFVLSMGEIKLEAVPYFFSTRNPKVGLDYAWSLDRQAVVPAQGSTLVLSTNNESIGTTRLDLQVKNASKVFQQGNTSASLTVPAAQSAISF